MTRSSSQSIVTNRIVVALSIYALLGGLLTLAGWYLSVVRLTDWLGTGISMFANTALAAACLGVALLVHALRRSWSRPVTAALGVFAMLIGCGTLFEHFSGINLGIDTLLVQRSWGFRGATAPGRMGLPASFSVTLLGLAMLLLPHKGRGRYAVPLLGVVVSSIATLGLVGYLFRADPLFSVAKLTAIAMQTGTIILALGLGVMAAVPDLEPVRTLFRKSAAGLLVRRALPFSILLPMALGWGFITGRNAGWFDRGMGMALLTLASMALFCGLLRWCALALEAHEDALQKAQQELVQVNKELERRVEERTASLREAMKQMEEFSYSISHDLRAPLRGMKAYTVILQQDFGDSLSGPAQDYLKRISANADRLEKMILDLLMLSRVVQTEFQLQPVAVDKLVRQIIEQYPGMQSPQALIEMERLPDVLGHEPSLTQAWSNLLNNAVKFVPPNVTPRIRIWSEQSNGNVRFWVADNGIGIPPKHQGRLFNMFERMHPQLKYEGTGVGLAIVRKAVERMGGKVGVQSDGVHGSQFWIELRKANASHTHPEAAPYSNE